MNIPEVPISLPLLSSLTPTSRSSAYSASRKKCSKAIPLSATPLLSQWRITRVSAAAPPTPSPPQDMPGHRAARKKIRLEPFLSASLLRNRPGHSVIATEPTVIVSACSARKPHSICFAAPYWESTSPPGANRERSILLAPCTFRRGKCREDDRTNKCPCCARRSNESAPRNIPLALPSSSLISVCTSETGWRSRSSSSAVPCHARLCK